MDNFKRAQRKRIGPGGWHCFCCGIQSGNRKKQKRNKAKARRYARRKAKQGLRR